MTPSDRSLRWTFRVAVALPLVVAAVALRPWAPVLDLAMTELRVRDVGGRQTPLIGLPGRIGRFPDQGSHPGPLSFYLLAIGYRLLGSSARSLLYASIGLNVAAAWAALAVGWRNATRRDLVLTGAIVLATTSWLGAGVLVQPWNPYLPLVPYLVVLLATWAVVRGETSMIVVQVAAASLCAQTHVPYLTLSVALVAVGLGIVIRRAIFGDRSAGDITSPDTATPDTRMPDTSAPRAARRSLAWAVGTGALWWLPVAVDQWHSNPGNITMLRRHFLDPPEPPQGLAVGVRTVLAHLDPLHVVVDLMTRSPRPLDDLAGGSWRVGCVVVAGLLVSGTVAVRRRERSLIGLHAVVVVSLLVGVLSTSRIFGKVWYYLTLWAWSLGIVAVSLTVATLWPILSARWPSIRTRRITLAGAAAVIALTTAATVEAVRVDPPEAHLSDPLLAIIDPTVTAIDDGVGAAVGPDGTYAVVWADAAYFGSQGYGLVNELERRGIDARGYPPYRVPLTPHRIAVVDEVDAEIVLVTGSKIARWSAVPGVVKVADVDLRSAAVRAEYDRLRAAAIAGLEGRGLDDLVALVDENLFGASVDERTPADVRAMLAEMLQLGQRTAVFVAAPGTFDDNP